MESGCRFSGARSSPKTLRLGLCEARGRGPTQTDRGREYRLEELLYALEIPVWNAVSQAVHSDDLDRRGPVQGHNGPNEIPGYPVVDKGVDQVVAMDAVERFFEIDEGDYC